MSDAVSPAGPSRVVRETPQPDPVTTKKTPALKRGVKMTKKTKTPRRPLPDWVEAGKPINFGPRRLLWLFYVWFRLYKLRWVPQPRPHGVYWFQAFKKIKVVRDLRKHSMAIVLVLTTKGGATKTTISTWLAAILNWVYKLSVLVFDIDTGGGKVARRYGLDPSKTLESRTAIDMVMNKEWAPTYQDFVSNLEADNETGVMVLHCKENDDVNSPTKREDIARALPVFKTGCHTLVVDTAPGFEKSITQGAADAATVMCVVGRPHSEEEMDDVKKTLDHEAYGLRAEGKQVFCVISGVRWFKYNTRTQYEYAERFGITPDKVILMPYVRHLFKVRNVVIGKLSPKALHAQVNLAEAVARAAVAYNEQHPPAKIGGESSNVVQSDGDILSVT